MKVWMSRRAKYLYRVVDERAGDDRAPLLSVSIHFGVVPRQSLTEDQPRADDLSNYKLCEAGDIVLNRMRAFQGGIGITKQRGLVSPDYLVLRSRPEVDGRYLHHLFRSGWFVGEMVSRLRGIGSTDQGNVRTPRINAEDLGDIRIPLPYQPEQRAIAAYLDAETARIDALIEQKQRLVALLGERRMAFASHLLQGGLSDVSEKVHLDISWIGPHSYPSTWSAIRLKHLCSMRSGEAIESDDIAPTGDYPVYGGNGVRGYSSTFTHCGTYPLIGRQGALCGNVHLASGRFWATEHAVVVSPGVRCDVRWLAEILGYMNLGQYSVSAAQPGLSVETVLNLDVPLPPVVEQRRLADLLDNQVGQIDAVVSRAERFIALAMEHRQALITAVVTGELDVPGVAA